MTIVHFFKKSLANTRGKDEYLGQMSRGGPVRVNFDKRHGVETAMSGK